jgi:predicted nuclease with TOPRIM domain
MENGNSIQNQKIKGMFVERNVVYCQSSLVEELLQKDPNLFEQIENMYKYEYDGELYTQEELNDKVEAAENEKAELEAQLDDMDGEDEASQSKRDEIEEKISDLDDQIYDMEHADTEPVEIFEWWLVDRWMAKRLRERGEAILEEYGCCWWGRCTTGQAILLDEVITDICRDMEILAGQRNEWK